MKKYFLIIIIASKLLALEKNQKFDIEFSALSLNNETQDIGFYQENTFKQITLAANSISPSIRFLGKPRVDFLKIKPEEEINDVNSNLKDESYSTLTDKSLTSYKTYVEIKKKYEDYYEHVEHLGPTATQSEIRQLDLLKKESEKSYQEYIEVINKASDARANAMKHIEISTPNKIKDNKTIKSNSIKTEPFATFTFNESGKYILFFYKENNTNKVYALADNKTSFPYGSFLYVNGSNYLLEIRYLDSKITLKPGEQKFIFPKNTNLQYSEEQISKYFDNEWILISNTKRYSNDDKRMIFVISNGMDELSPIGIRSVTQYKPENEHVGSTNQKTSTDSNIKEKK